MVAICEPVECFASTGLVGASGWPSSEMSCDDRRLVGDIIHGLDKYGRTCHIPGGFKEISSPVSEQV